MKLKFLIYLLGAFYLSPFSLVAQDMKIYEINQSEKNSILNNQLLYFSGQPFIGNYYGGSPSLYYVAKNNLSIDMSAVFGVRKARNIPEDFRSGFFSSLARVSNDPVEEILIFYLGLGRNYQVKHNKYRLITTIGPYFRQTRTISNWERRFPNMFNDNYTYEYQNTMDFGILLKSSFVWNIDPLLDLTIGPIWLIKRSNHFACLYFGVNFGKVK